MWQISRIVYGLLVWPLLMTSAMTFSRNLRTVDGRSGHKPGARPSLQELQTGPVLLMQKQGDKPDVLHDWILHAQKVTPKVQPAAHVLRSHPTALQSVMVRISSSLHAKRNTEQLLLLVFVGIFVLGLLYTFLVGVDTVADPSFHFRYSRTLSPIAEEKAPSTPEIKDAVAKVEVPAKKAMNRALIEGGDTPNTKANLLKLEADLCTGTWATTYRTAQRGTKSKEALELLFRCNIIPIEEFADSDVSQEHIDECVWISSQMLRERSLEEWVVAGPQAAKTFEESVLACFAARTDAVANIVETRSPSSPGSYRSDTGRVDCRSPDILSPVPRQQQQQYGSKLSTMNTLAEVVKQIPSPVASQTSPVQQSRSNAQSPTTSTSSQGRRNVVSRVREIMREVPVTPRIRDVPKEPKEPTL